MAQYPDTGTPNTIAGSDSQWTYYYGPDGKLYRRPAGTSNANTSMPQSYGRGRLYNEIADFANAWNAGQNIGGAIFGGLGKSQRVSGNQDKPSKGGLSDAEQKVFDSGTSNYDSRRSAIPPAPGSSSNGAGAPGSVIGGTQATDLPTYARSFLDAISGPESGGKYNVRYTPNGSATFNSYDQHPNIAEKTADGRTSTAAGRYEILASTWNSIPDSVKGDGSFSPQNQDQAAWWLAQRDYKARRGRDLGADLQKNGGLTPSMADALKPTWPSINVDRFNKLYAAAHDNYILPDQTGQQPTQVAENGTPDVQPVPDNQAVGPQGETYTPAPNQWPAIDAQQDADQDQDDEQDAQDDTPSYFGGGTVNPTRGPGRNDQVVAVGRGVRPNNFGTNPGGGYSARSAIPVPGYSLGGEVRAAAQTFNTMQGNGYYDQNGVWHDASSNGTTPNDGTISGAIQGAGQQLLNSTGIQGGIDQAQDAVQDAGDNFSQAVQQGAQSLGSALGFDRGGAVDPYGRDKQATLPAILGGGPQPPRAIAPQMPGYDDGGAVDGDESDAPAPPQASQQQASDPITQLISGVGDAIHSGITALQDAFGLKPGVVAPDQQTAQGRSAFMSGQGAMPQDAVQKVTDTVDPDHQLNDSLRNAAGLKALHDYYLQQGNPQRAAQVAGAMLQTFTNEAAMHGDQALKLLQSGDTQGGIDALTKAYGSIPDGKTASGIVNRDGTVTVTQSDANGQPIAQKTVTPQDLMGLALGFKNKTAAWNALANEAGGRWTSTVSDPAYDNYVNGQQAIPAAPNAPAAPTTPATPATAGGNPTPAPSAPATAGGNPAPQAPTAPAGQGDGAPLSPQQAQANFLRNNPKPVMPDTSQMTDAHRKQAQADYAQRASAWTAQFNQTMKNAQKDFSDYMRNNQPTEFDLQSPANSKALGDAVTASIANSPPAFDLPNQQAKDVYGRQMGQITAGILSAGNNVPIQDAADFARSLTQDPSLKLSKAPDRFGNITVQLPSGESFKIGQQPLRLALGLQQQQARAIAEKQAAAAKAASQPGLGSNIGSALGAVGSAIGRGASAVRNYLDAPVQ